jgi:hypothetical protein
MLTHDKRKAFKEGSRNIANSFSRIVQYGERIPLQSNCTAEKGSGEQENQVARATLMFGNVALHLRPRRCWKAKLSPLGPPVMA